MRQADLGLTPRIAHVSNAGMTSTSGDLVALSFDTGIATLQLERPDARNALSLDMIEQMHDALARIASTQDLRVMVLCGSGKSFCAGMDLKAVQDDPTRMGSMLRKLADFNAKLRRLPVPTIASVQGAAIGGGCGLMTVCDFAVTHPEAKLGFPEVDLGICPAVIAPWLIKRIGNGRARSILLSGGTMSGEEGYAVGLASHLVAREEMAHTVDALTENIIAGGPNAIAATKQWLNELDGSLDDAVLQRGADISAEMIQGAEAQERLGRLFGR